MTTPDHWPISRTPSGTPPAATDLVFLLPEGDATAPKSRTLEEVGGTFAADAGRAGVIALVYWDPSETRYQTSVAGVYRHTVLELPSQTLAVGERIVLWVEDSHPDTVWELVDSTDLANAGGLSAAHTVRDNFVVLEATVARTSPGVFVKMSGDLGTAEAPVVLRWTVHGAWRVSADADQVGLEGLKAAVQSAVEAEAFPPPYATGRAWSPGEYFYLQNAVYVTVEHSIAVEPADVPTSPHFRKVVDGAASRSDDIDARVANWAEADNTDPIPADKLPDSATPPTLRIGGRNNTLINLAHGGQTVTLPGALHTMAGLLRGTDQAKLDGLTRNNFRGQVVNPANYSEGDVVYQIVGRRLLLGRALRDFQTLTGRLPADQGQTYWTLLLDYTAPAPSDPGRLYMIQRHDGRIAYGFGGEQSVSSDDDGTVITSTAIPTTPLTLMHNRHEWASDAGTYYPENVVRRSGVRYICLVEHDASDATKAPGTGSAQATYWEAW